ncbi:hypothetical protein F0U63_35710 [Cystobacter fuscus]|nr:hypothetical protein F0U63_35710 [Cystobacter fuscus]
MKPGAAEDEPTEAGGVRRVRCLFQRDRVSLDIFWLKDESLEDSANLPEPDVVAGEIVDDLRAALEPCEASRRRCQTTRSARPGAGSAGDGRGPVRSVPPRSRRGLAVRGA